MTDDKTYECAVVRITELVGVDGLLDGFTFLKCHIEGPAVIVLSGSRFIGNDLGASSDVLLWELPGDRLNKVGVILAQHCVFEECEFRNVGIAGPRRIVEELRHDMNQGLSPSS